MRVAAVVFVCACAAAALAQQDASEPPVTDAKAPAASQAAPASGWRQTDQAKQVDVPQQAAPAKPATYVLEPGTRIPLSLINTVSTKYSAEGDRVYLETAFPITLGNRVIIPPGSYVQGTITEVKRPGRIKGRGELYLRFDTLTLPNGVTRDFRARIGSVNGNSSEDLDKDEGKIRSPGTKGDDARKIGEAASVGAGVGVMTGPASGGHYGMGAGIGAAAGAAAGVLGVLLTRGPDVVLQRGSTMEMVLDRTVTFSESEIDFANPAPAPQPTVQRTPLPSRRQEQHKNGGILLPGRDQK